MDNLTYKIRQVVRNLRRDKLDQQDVKNMAEIIMMLKDKVSELEKQNEALEETAASQNTVADLENGISRLEKKCSKLEKNYKSLKKNFAKTEAELKYLKRKI